MTPTDTNSHFFGSDDRPVFRIIVYSLSLAFAVLVASLETLRATDAGFAFRVSWRTLLVFVLGAAIFVPCFKTIFLSPSRKWSAAGLVLVVLIGAGSFLYPLRFVANDKLAAILTGLVIAVCFLSTIGGMLWAISRFLNADERKMELETEASPAPGVLTDQARAYRQPLPGPRRQRERTGKKTNRTVR